MAVVPTITSPEYAKPEFNIYTKEPVTTINICKIVNPINISLSRESKFIFGIFIIAITPRSKKKIKYLFSALNKVINDSNSEELTT